LADIVLDTHTLSLSLTLNPSLFTTRCESQVPGGHVAGRSQGPIEPMVGNGG